MNLQQDRIASTCERLGLHRMAVEWTGLAQDAARKEVSYADFLEQLLAIENGARLERQRDTLMKLATLPSVRRSSSTISVSPVARHGRRSRSSPASHSSNAPRTSYS